MIDFILTYPMKTRMNDSNPNCRRVLPLWFAYPHALDIMTATPLESSSVLKQCQCPRTDELGLYSGFLDAVRHMTVH